MISTMIIILVACIVARWILLSVVKTASKVKNTWDKETKREKEVM